MRPLRPLKLVPLRVFAPLAAGRATPSAALSLAPLWKDYLDAMKELENEYDRSPRTSPLVEVLHERFEDQSWSSRRMSADPLGYIRAFDSPEAGIRTFVALNPDNNRVLGDGLFSALRDTPDTGKVSDVLRPSARGQHYGRPLLYGLCREGARAGFKTLIADIQTTNTLSDGCVRELCEEGLALHTGTEQGNKWPSIWRKVSWNRYEIDVRALDRRLQGSPPTHPQPWAPQIIHA